MTAELGSLNPAIAKVSDTLAPITLDIRPHILLVDDDHKIRTLASKALTRFGFMVDAVEDGAIAWGAIQQESFDLIVTDNDMPNLTGMGLLQKLYAARMALPVIMTTGDFPYQELMQHPWLEIQAVLLKPYTFSELLDKVTKVLRSSCGQSELVMSPVEADRLNPVRLAAF